MDSRSDTDAPAPLIIGHFVVLTLGSTSLGVASHCFVVVNDPPQSPRPGRVGEVSRGGQREAVLGRVIAMTSLGRASVGFVDADSDGFGGDSKTLSMSSCCCLWSGWIVTRLNPAGPHRTVAALDHGLFRSRYIPLPLTRGSDIIELSPTTKSGGVSVDEGPQPPSGLSSGTSGCRPPLAELKLTTRSWPGLRARCQRRAARQGGLGCAGIIPSSSPRHARRTGADSDEHPGGQPGVEGDRTAKVSGLTNAWRAGSWPRRSWPSGSPRHRRCRAAGSDELAKKQILQSVRKDWSILVIRGSGGLADEITDLWQKRTPALMAQVDAMLVGEITGNPGALIAQRVCTFVATLGFPPGRGVFARGVNSRSQAVAANVGLDAVEFSTRPLHNGLHQWVRHLQDRFTRRPWRYVLFNHTPALLWVMAVGVVGVDRRRWPLVGVALIFLYFVLSLLAVGVSAIWRYLFFLYLGGFYMLPLLLTHHHDTPPPDA